MPGKLGPHIVEGYSGELGSPSLVTLVDASVSYVAQVRAEVPNARIVMRWENPDQPLDNPRINALDWYARHEADIIAIRNIGAVFQGYNEIPDTQAVPYAEFETERAGLLHGIGARMAWLSSSVGTPAEGIADTIYKPLTYLMRDGDLWAMHCYWPTPGQLTNPWLALRWTLHRWLDDVPIAITETGQDHVDDPGLPPSEQGAYGWRTQYAGNAGAYLADLCAYRQMLDTYPNVVGATVFGCGRIYSPWESYDANPIYAQLVREDHVPQPPPLPDPEPDPDPDPSPCDCEGLRAEIAALSSDQAELRAQLGRAATTIAEVLETLADDLVWSDD